jgi:hypothetical protein
MSDSRRRLLVVTMVMLLASWITGGQSVAQNVSAPIVSPSAIPPGRTAQQTEIQTYTGTFVAHAIEGFGFEETFTGSATGTIESDTEGTIFLEIDLASVRVGTHDTPVHVSTSCSIPLIIDGDTFSGSAEGVCWVNVRIEASGTFTADTMAGTWRLHALLIPPYDDPGYAEDTGFVPFTLTK